MAHRFLYDELLSSQEEKRSFPEKSKSSSSLRLEPTTPSS